MTEEDEIDILGDFQLDSDSNLYDGTALISQNSELLNCDYTIHPQWLLDRPSTNPDNWYETDDFQNLGEKVSPDTDSTDTGACHLSTENSITDESGWTEKEKNLLERGIEIFGKSNVRLSQFIGSKSAPEVKYYLKNFYLENHANRKSSECALEGDVLDDAQIPASIEEVIAAVSTGKPTLHLTNQRSRKKSHSTGDPNDKELIDRTPATPKKKKTYSESTSRRNTPGVKFRIKSKLKEPFQRRIIKQKTVKIVNTESNINEIKRVEITTGRGLAVPICEGEEIVKIKNVTEDSDTDVDIDVETSDNEAPIPIKTNNDTISSIKEQKPIESCDDAPTDNLLDLSKMDEALLKELESLEAPECELKLDICKPSELEKVLNYEYFTNACRKTPERYMKIRNHILQGWHSQKPKYLHKTISRQGLKNCGDVNCFGKIHYFLEQMGAVNFGCEQVNYERPLLDALKEKLIVKEKRKGRVKEFVSDKWNASTARARPSKKFNNDGEGGYTMSHDENGLVIKHTIINENPVVKQKQYLKKPTIRLIYCRPFKDDMLQPYKIKIDLTTLLTMDFHAHSCMTEVMGLISGRWRPDDNVLIISHYEPCLNIASSATHCDMCPISQAIAADSIHARKLDILGWFHSHPTFAPEPSNQDLETQQSVQKWIGQRRPCVGMILSPFSLNGALIASPYRCLVVERGGAATPEGVDIVPYKFKVDVDDAGFDVGALLENLRRVQRCDFGTGERHRVDFRRPYLYDANITYLEKYITSVRMHLAKLGTLSKQTCESIIKGISSVCRSAKKEAS
ncbi:unnamed protein product [Phyllotreta striolata]|uniref:Myb-like, SWIRM and MPN domain-containing protein 1 n=1 Tax=Phyllotreta striolata TaxID=444603 RepID=A0A9N9TNV9_PHYSR|nr:unnamed protein product [Phyllotreta striolata]